YESETVLEFRLLLFRSRIVALPPLKISPGTLVTLAILAVILYPALAAPAHRDPSTAVALALAIAVFLIVSVLVHEISHALSAKAFGGHVDHDALTLWGGHTQYRPQRSSALASVTISLAGPASNLLLAAVATGMGALSDLASEPGLFWWFSARLNLVLAVFNLL